MQGLPPIMQTTPGVTIPNFSEEPMATEGEMTPGPPEENPYEQQRELRERVNLERQKRAHDKDRLMDTVPNPENPDLPPALINDSPTQGTDPYVFDDVEDEVDSLGLPGIDNQPRIGGFNTGSMFQF